MKKNHLKSNKRFGEKFAIDQMTEEKNMETIGFSLTPRETKLYKDWVNSLFKEIEMDDTEDSYVLYPKF